MEKLKITLPKAWSELDDQQLYYVFNLIADNLSGEQIKTYCMFRFGHVKMICRYGNSYLVKKGKEEYLVNALVITQAIQALNFLDDVPEKPVRILKIKGNTASDAQLKDLDFQSYLYIENLYQGFLVTQQHDMLQEMGRILYDDEKLTFSQAEKMNVFYWWTAVKVLFSRQFPHLFTTASEGENGNLIGDGRSLKQKLQDAMNNQIRALTKGDITKEEQILKMNLWRALTELDNLAREAIELNAKFKHNA